MRRALVAGNWKMHGSAAQVSEVLTALRDSLGDGIGGVDIVVCPPAPYLDRAQEVLRGSAVQLGAQNVWYESSGAFTGEIAPAMLADFHVRYVLTGHSERRQWFGEDDALVARKFMAIRGAGCVPVLCVGEKLDEREAGDEESVVGRQLQAVLDAGGVAALEQAVIAYEPVWAIGTGRTATPEQAQAMHAYIRRQVASLDETVASGLRIVYGGSVKPDNAAELFARPDIDGGLIGGASLDAASFERICNSVS
ncbi:MAG: triose-phosphate isomerase [Pseudohongiellaceae bacterium]